MFRWVGPAVGIAGIAALAACTASADSTPPTSKAAAPSGQTPVSAMGTLEGTVVFAGGPRQSKASGPSSYEWPAAGFALTIHRDATGEESTVTTDTSGRFRIDLPAGAYTLDCWPEEHAQGSGSAATRPEQIVMVSAGETITAICVEPIP